MIWSMQKARSSDLVVFGSGLLDKLVAKQRMELGKAVTVLAGVKLESRLQE